MFHSNPLQLLENWKTARPHWLIGPLVLTVSITLAGCASAIPESIRDQSALTPVDVAQVQAQPERHLGQRVRWGGTIIAVTNLARTTEIEILSRPLDRDGAPIQDTDGQGRFIALSPGFLDPTQFPKDRDLTVVGVITGVQTRPVGDYPYRYPLVQTETHYLWPEQSIPVPYPWYGPWYDPWFGPWYGPPLGYRPGPWFY